MEIWKPLKDFSNYEVSNTGKIKNSRTGRILKNSLCDGYLLTGLKYRGTNTRPYIHRLVAQAFIPNPENKPQVNHKDGNRSNNHLSNLEWVTPSENNLDAHARRKLMNKKNNMLTKRIKMTGLNKIFRDLIVDYGINMNDISLLIEKYSQ